MTLGEQITTLRKKKGISQADLGKLVETSGDIIGRYERNEVKPSIEVVIRYQALPETDKEHIFYVIDNLIKAAKLKTL